MPLAPVIVIPQQFTSGEATLLASLADLSWTNGDILYYNNGFQRLAKGSNTNVLTLSGGLPSWAAGGGGSGTVISVASADGSITVTNPTTTVDLAVVKSPILSTARTIGGVSFNGSANITVASATGGFTVTGGALAVSDATTPAITLASGSTNTGNITINGKTSGSLKITTADATAQAITLTVAAQTVGAATLTIPNMANTNKTLAWLESPSFTTPTLGVASATSLATSAASPLLLTNGQLVTVALTSQTVGGATLTIPNFANVSDTFVFITLAQTLSNKTFVSPILGTPTSGTLTNCTGLPAAAVVAGTFGSGSYTMSAQLTVLQIVNTSNAIAASGNAATVPITSRVSTVTNNSAATLTITMTTTSAVDGQMVMVRILDASAVAQTITWVNTENSTVTAPVTSNGSTTLPLTVGFQYNSGTSKWRCIALA